MFNQFLSLSQLLLMRLSQSDLEKIGKYCGITAIIGFGIYIVMLIVGFIVGIQKAKDNAKDNNKPEVHTNGIVLEKHVETTRENGGAFVFTQTVEWIIFEDESGSRRRYRNINPAQIFIAKNDRGTLITKGETIYGFMRASKNNNAE